MSADDGLLVQADGVTAPNAHLPDDAGVVGRHGAETNVGRRAVTYRRSKTSNRDDRQAVSQTGRQTDRLIEM